MEKSVPDTPPQRVAALVLGAAVLPGGQPSAALKRRALHAARLYREGRVARIIASGGPDGATPTEAQVIGRLCRTGGVPPEHLVLEERAGSTAENIAYALPLIQSHGISALVLVTDRFHARRAMLTARAMGLSPEIDCPPVTERAGPGVWRVHIREWGATVIYLWRLRRGR